MSEFVCLPLIWLVALGVRDSDLGSSGTFFRNVSKDSLNSSKEQFFVFLRVFGMELNNLGPDTWKD